MYSRKNNEIRKFDFLKKYIHFTTPEVYGSTNGWVKENFNFKQSAKDLFLTSQLRTAIILNKKII